MIRGMAVENQDLNDSQEYMDLDEFFTALQDYNSVTPFGKPQGNSRKRRNGEIKTDGGKPVHSSSYCAVIRSQLRIGKLVLDSFDCCPCGGREIEIPENEDSLRTSVYDSVLVNHLMSLLPTKAKQEEKPKQSTQVLKPVDVTCSKKHKS